MDTSAQFALEQKSVQTAALLNTLTLVISHAISPSVPIAVRNIQLTIRDAQDGSKKKKLLL